MPAATNQRVQSVENFRRERDGLPFAQQPPFCHVQAKGAELIEMFVGSAHQRSRKASQEIFKLIPSFSKGLLDASGFRLCRQQLRGACWFFNTRDRCVGNSMASQADRARETMRERD